MPDRICPICGRPQRTLYETVDGPTCTACTKYVGPGRRDPASWRYNATRGAVGREWPGRPPTRSKGGDD